MRADGVALSLLSTSVKLAALSSIAALPLVLASPAQTETKQTETTRSSLQEHYDSAQHSLKSGDPDQAANEFRGFLAGAQGELAVGHAAAGDYARAASLFAEALALQPSSPTLQLGYAKAALLMGDSSRAESAARAFLKNNSADSQSLAQAHQILGRALHKMNNDQEGRRELEAAVALDASFANSYDLAVVCLDLDDEKCAVQLFGEMQASFGDTPDIHVAFGRAYGDSDFAPRAVAEFKKAIEQNPRFPTAHYCLAAALLETGQDEATVQAAETELKKELAISPNDFLTFAALGKIAATHYRYAEADKYLKRATSLNPKNPDAFLYLGQMYFDTGKLTDAEAALRQAIRLTTDPSRNRYQIQKAHYLLGRILMQQHRESDARAEMQIARDLANKGLSRDKSELAGLLSNNAATTGPAGPSMGSATTIQNTEDVVDPEAVRKLNAFEKELTPAIADSYNNLGAIAATARNYSDALNYFERAAAWNPSLNGLDYNLGRAAFMASRFAEAVPPLSRYAGSHPDDSGIRVALAMSRFMTQDYSGCIQTLKGVQDQTASIPQMQYVYAESLVKTGQVTSGVERLESLASSHPEIADVHRGLGEAFQLKGERQKAINELHTALQLNAKDPEAHYDLGKMELQNGATTTAIAELQAAVQLMPSDPRFHQELAKAYKLVLRMSDAEKEQRLYQQLTAPKPEANAGELHDKQGTVGTQPSH
jgi:predicted Zn-dependent protease